MQKKFKMAKTFIGKMLSGSPEVSSKRVIGVTSFLMVLLIANKVLFTRIELPNEGLINDVLDTLFLIIAATVLGGTVENLMQRRSPIIPSNDEDVSKKEKKNKEEEPDPTDLDV